MVGRGELTDKAWEQIMTLLPENGRRGQQWKDHRKVINGILWKLRLLMCNELYQQVRQMAQRSAQIIIDPLCAGIRHNLGS